MGSLYACCCSDPKAELEMRCSLPYSSHLNYSYASCHDSTGDQKLSETNAEDSAALTIATYWRGYTARKFIQHIVRTSKSRYFQRAEVLETLKKAPLSLMRETKNLKKYGSGAEYRGQWLGGFRDGLGTMNWPDGAMYTGNWTLGYPWGEGKFTAADGDSYQGNWRTIFSQGRTSNCKTGDGWQNSVKDGFEWLRYKEENRGVSTIEIQKSAIKGALKEITKKIASIRNELQAQRALDAAEGKREGDTIYTGMKLDNKKYGYGQLTYDNGDTYFGYWKADKQHGHGLNIWADGSEFIGVYSSDDKDGPGNYIWEDKTNYIGEWTRNLMHGYGRYTWPDGRKYEGEWRNGMMQGFGVYIYADGKRYEGEWFKGKKHGIGINYLPNGTSSKEVWNLGRLTR